MPPAARLLTDALHTALISSGPFLLAALGAGLLSALVLSWTKLEDGALRAFPRVVAAWLAIWLSAGFVAAQLVTFATHAYGSLFELAR